MPTCTDGIAARAATKGHHANTHFLTSRKFWAAVIAVLVIVLRSTVPTFPISDQLVSDIVLTLIAYIIGTGLSDIKVHTVK